MRDSLESNSEESGESHDVLILLSPQNSLQTNGSMHNLIQPFSPSLYFIKYYGLDGDQIDI